MPDIDRRRFIVTTGGGIAAASLATAGTVHAASAASSDRGFAIDPYQLGVASGDPDETSVVLWTRLAPEPTQRGFGMDDQPDQVTVHWRIAESEADLASDASCVDFGDATAKRRHAYSVHPVAGEGANPLRPGTWYYYRFQVGADDDPDTVVSPVGRTRTAPAADTVEEVNFAVVDCQSFVARPYNGYRHLSDPGRDKMAFVVHIGDYIYENGFDGHLPDHPCTSLSDYRIRYGQYKSNRYIRATHQRYPFYAVPDDHEFWNNVCGAEVSEPDGDNGIRRFNAAMKAYWENMPFRGFPSKQDDGKRQFTLRRDIRWGKLLQLLLLDTRQHRTTPGTGDERTILGTDQRGWLKERIESSTATWLAIGTGVTMQGTDGLRDLGEKWPGYPRDRRKVTRWLGNRRAEDPNFNPVVLSGDLHCGMATVVQNAESTDVAPEFMTPSMTSRQAQRFAELAARTRADLPWFGINPDTDRPWRGYLRCRVREDHWAADYIGDSASGSMRPRATWRVDSGQVRPTKTR